MHRSRTIETHRRWWLLAVALVASVSITFADAPVYSAAIAKFHKETGAAWGARRGANDSLLAHLNTLAAHGLRPLRTTLIPGNDTHFADLTRPLRDSTPMLSAATPEPERWGPVQRSHLLVTGCPCFLPSAPGHVPDGRFVSGPPLLIAKNPSDPALLDLTWGASCSAASDYSVHEGTIESWYSHNALVCSTAGLLAATVTPSAGDTYYLVVPLSADAEGSYGVDVLGIERPPSPSACRAQQQVSSCP